MAERISGPAFMHPPIGGQYLLLGASSAAATAATLVSGVILARLLSVEERGLVALIVYWAGLAAALGNLSLPDAFIYRARKSARPLAEHLSTMLLTVLGSALIVAAIAAVMVTVFAARFSGVPVAFAAMVVAAFVLINHANGAFISAERFSLDFTRLAAERVALPLLYSLLLLGMFVAGEVSVEIVALVFLGSRIPIMAYRAWRYRRRLIRPIDRDFAQDSIKAGARFHTVACVRFFNEQADTFAVNLLWSTASVGYFVVGYSTAGAAYSLIGQALSLMALPVAAKLREGEVAGHLAQSLRITLLLTIVAMVPLILLAPAIVPLVFGAKFAPAAEVAQVLAIAMLPAPLLAQTDATLRARGLSRVALSMQLIALVIFGTGWIATGYDDIVSLGIMLAVSRGTALVITLAIARRDLTGLRLRDCLVWRRSDLRTIRDAVGSAAHRLRNRRTSRGGTGRAPFDP